MDCRDCIPPIAPENEDAEKIYLTVQDQYILSMGGAVAINHMAIHAAMELYDIEFRKDVFEKVLAVSRYFIHKMNDESKQKRGK